MAKMNLLGDTVLRRDQEGKLHLMNRREGGFRSWAFPIESEEALLDRYHVRLGEWTRDEHGEYCPVTRIPREEQPTLHDGEEAEVFKLHDCGPRGVVPMSPELEHAVLAPYLRDGSTEREAFERFMATRKGAHVVSDGLNDEALRELLSNGVEFGPRGVGIGGDIRQYRRPDGEVFKVRMDSGQVEALDRMMEANGTPLVPVVVDGEVVKKQP